MKKKGGQERWGELLGGKEGSVESNLLQLFFEKDAKKEIKKYKDVKSVGQGEGIPFNLTHILKIIYAE